MTPVYVMCKYVLKFSAFISYNFSIQTKGHLVCLKVLICT